MQRSSATVALVLAKRKPPSEGPSAARLAVAVQSDHPNQVAEFTQQRALPFKVAFDSSGDISRRFGDTPLLPESVLIDRQGRIVARFAGEPEWAALHAAIEKALGS